MGPGHPDEWDLRLDKTRRSADAPVVRKPDARSMRRTLVSLTALAVLFATAAPATDARPDPVRLDALSAAVLVQINQVRLSRGLRALRPSARLTAAAAQHSGEMARRGYFEHVSWDGSAFWKRIQRYYGRRGYRSWSVGENLLWSSPDVDAAGALKMWLTSPKHRAVLLGRDWREIGLAAVHATSAPGLYKGDEVTIVTTDFGVRR